MAVPVSAIASGAIGSFPEPPGIRGSDPLAPATGGNRAGWPAFNGQVPRGLGYTPTKGLSGASPFSTPHFQTVLGAPNQMPLTTCGDLSGSAACLSMRWPEPSSQPARGGHQGLE